MRNKGGREDVKCLGFSSHCGDRRSFFSEICRHLGKSNYEGISISISDFEGNFKTLIILQQLNHHLKYRKN
jgi:hypothetical protein